jgi:hypothetical protein
MKYSHIYMGMLFRFFEYFIQHCFICRPSSTVPEDAGVEPSIVASCDFAIDMTAIFMLPLITIFLLFVSCIKTSVFFCTVSSRPLPKIVPFLCRFIVGSVYLLYV